MANEVGTLEAILDLNASGFTLEARKAGQTLRSLEGQFDQTAKRVAQLEHEMAASQITFHDAVLTMGALRFALMDLDDVFLKLPRSIAEASGHLERMQMLMTGLSDKSDFAERLADGMKGVSEIIAMSKNSPFDMDTISEGFVRFKAVGLDPTTQGLQTLTDAASKYGASKAQMSEATLAIQEMAAKGVVEMKELRRQLGQAIPEAVEDMAHGLGMSMGELVKATKSGGLEASTAMAKMFAQMEISAAGAAQRMKESYTGLTNQLKTSITLMETSIGGQGFMTEVKKSMKDFTDFMNSDQGAAIGAQLGQALKSVAETVSVLARQFASFIGTLSEFSGTIKVVGEALFLYFGGQKLAANVELIRAKFAEMTKGLDAQVAAVRKAKADEAAVYEQQAGVIAQKLKQQQDAEAKQVEARAAGLAKIKKIQQEELQDSINAIDTVVQRQKLKYDELEALKAGHAEKMRQLAAAESGSDLAVQLKAEAAEIAKARTATQAHINSLTRMIQTRQGNVAAINNEIAAERRNVEAIEGAIAAINQEAAATARDIEAKMGLARASAAAGEGVTRLAVGVRALGASLLVTGGYMAAFAVIVAGIEALYDKITGAAKRAEEQANVTARAIAHQSTAEDVRKEKEELEKLNEALRKAQAVRNSIKGDRKDLSPTYQGIADDADEQIRVIKARIEQINADLAKSVPQIAADNIRTNVTGAMERINEALQLDPSVQDLTVKLEKLKQEEIKAREENDKAKLKALAPIFQEYGKQVTQMRLDIFDRESQKALAAVKEPKELAELKKQIEEERTRLLQNRTRVNSPTGILTEGKETDPWATHVRSQLEEYQRLKLKMLEVSGEIVTSAQVLENARRQVEIMTTGAGALTHKKNEPASAAEKEQLAQMIARNAEAQRGIKDFEQLKSVLSAANASLEASGNAFGSMGQKANPELERLFRTLSNVRGTMPEVTQALKGMGIDIEALNQKTAEQVGLDILNKDAIKASYSLDTLTRKTEQFGLTTREKAAVAVREHIAEIKKEDAAIDVLADQLVALGGLTEEVMIKVTEMHKLNAKRIEQTNLQLRQDTQSAVQMLADQWSKGYENLDKAGAGWIQKFSDQLLSGKLKVKDFVRSVLADLAKIKIEQAVSGALASKGDSLISGLGSMLGIKNTGSGGKGEKGTQANPMIVKNASNALDDPSVAAATKTTDLMGGLKDAFTQGLSGLGEMFSSLMTGLMEMLGTSSASGGLESMLTEGAMFAFANGGVMSSAGSMSLRAYANGGIANTPQLAMYGEGSTPEAFVPLPDGRSIPVRMAGGGSGSGAPPSVTVNMVNNSGMPVAGSVAGQRWDGRQMILDVVMDGMGSTGAFRESMHSAISGAARKG